MAKKWVYLFTEVEDAEKYVNGSWDKVRSLLGGKGANLFEMTRIKLPVPPGFTVTTEACNAYLAAGNKFPEGMWEQELVALKAIEEDHRQGLRRRQESVARLLPLRRQRVDAGHDGHRPQHRPDRCDRRGPGRADAESALRVGRLSPPDRGLRQGRAGYLRHRVRACARRHEGKGRRQAGCRSDHRKPQGIDRRVQGDRQEAQRLRLPAGPHRPAPPGD